MTVVLVAVAGGYALLLIALKLARGRMSSAQLATFVQWARAAVSEAQVYRVATDAERKDAPSVNVDGMRELGAMVTTFRGTTGVSRYVIDDTRTIVATRHGAALFLSSRAGEVEYSTYCLKAGMPCAPPEVEREWFPIQATDREMLIAHRARIAKAAVPLLRIATIEQLVELETEWSRRSADWRATQNEGDLFEADLRSILRDSYAARSASVKAKLGSLVPRARVIS